MNCIRYKIIISFDGSAYVGWQWQANGMTVQQRIEEAIEAIFNISVRIHGSSRTDTGVHAIGMVAHFDIPLPGQHGGDGNTESPLDGVMSSEKLPLALNSQLPEDIRIVSAGIVPESFHARFSATGKQYRYFIWNHRHANPHLRKTSWHVTLPLDTERMRAAAGFLPGTHDFRSFANNHTYPVEDTVRTITRVNVRKSGPLITIIIEGDGFLYKMCRGITGTLKQIGCGKFEPDVIPSMIAQKNREYAGQTAPAHGLFLWKVFYGETE